MIQLTANALRRILDAGEAAYPEECCGALLGMVTSHGRYVSETLRIANKSPEMRERRFRIEPQDYRAAEAEASARSLVLVGFYHSHPDHPARPSAHDLAMALPWHSYVIIAVESGHVAAWTSWILAPDRSRFEREGTAVGSLPEPTPSGGAP